MSTSEKPRSPRAWIIAVFATILAVIAAVLVPMSAQANTVELSGAVTDPTGKDLAGVSVSAIEITLGIPSTLATTTTSSSGAYAFAALPTGTGDTLQFGATSTTYPQYLGDTSDLTAAETFDLTAAGSFHSTINASLAPSGSISGTVKSITHAALKGYTVRAFADGNDSTPVRSGVSVSTGVYTITGLEPGSYQLEALDTAASPPYGPVYSGGTASLDSATPVDVGGSKTTSYSFTLGKAGGISGVVSGDITSGEQPLGDVRVTPYLLTGTPGSGFTDSTTTGMPSTLTSSTGAYSLHGLMPGYYTVEFTPGSSTPLDSNSVAYGQSFLDGGDGYVLTAGYVHVVGGTTATGQNEDLGEQTSATVNVTDSSSSDPIQNILVTIDHLGGKADQPGDNATQTKVTDSNGSVTFTGLGSGFYQVTIGSNTGAEGTITTYQREIVDFNNQLVGGQPATIENVQATLKDLQGLYATAQPTFSCCGGGPWTVGEYVAVDPQEVAWNMDDVDPATTTVQWYRNGAAIPGATNTNYLLQVDDAGQSILAVLTGHDLAYGSGTAQSVAEVIGDGNFYANGGGGGAYGTEKVGQTLTYQSDGWSLQGVNQTLTWQTSPNGTSGWTDITPFDFGTTYTLQPSDLGNYVRVDVVATKTGYNTVHSDTPAVYVYTGDLTVLAQPKLTTTSTTWSVSSGTWSPNAGTTQYTWYVAGHQISDITNTLSRTGTTGESVAVQPYREPTGYDPYFTPQIVAQVGTAPLPANAMTISGSPQYGATLNAVVPGFTPSVSSVNCVWQYESGSTWKSIAGANTCSYTTALGDIGRTLRVVLTTSLLDYATRTLIATEPTPIARLPLTNTILPFVSGSYGTADVPTVGNGAWSATPSAFSYRWVYSATGVAPYKTAPGVSNQSSYVVPQSLLGQHLLVEETASLSGHVTTTVTVNAGLVSADSLTIVALPKAILSGNAVTGETLTESGVSFSPAATSAQYNWYFYAPNNSSAVDSLDGPGDHSIAVPPGDVHDIVRMQVGGSRSGYDNPTYTESIVVKKGDNLSSGSLTIGSAVVGASDNSSGVTWAVNATTLSYQWQYKVGSTWKSIPGATAFAWIPTGTYLGKVVRMVETATAANYNTASVDSNSVTVSSGDAPVAGTGANSPMFDGGMTVGDTLTINPGTWSIGGLTFSYQWQTSPNGTTWTNIPGATSSHIVIPESAYVNDDYLGVVIKASRTGYSTGQTQFSTPGQALEGDVPLVKAPTVKVTSTSITVSTGTWGGTPPVMYSYAWVGESPSGSIAILASGPLTGPTFPRSGVPAGYAVYADVIANETNYNEGNDEVLALSGGPITPTTPITVTGTPATLSTLTASWTAFSVSAPNVTYQWYRSGKAIAGATSQTYEPVAADIGKIDSVILTVSDIGWTTEKYSAASTVVQNGASIGDDATPTITGTPAVDDVLTVHSAIWTQSGVTDHYQWMRGNLPITGATGTTYTVTATDLGNDIYVYETGTKTYFTPGYSQGGPVTIGYGTQLMPATPVKISGTVGIGKVLTESSGAWNFPVTLTYTWQFEAQGSLTWNSITGATASTYTPELVDITPPGLIRVIVHASRPGHDTIAITSAVVSIT